MCFLNYSIISNTSTSLLYSFLYLSNNSFTLDLYKSNILYISLSLKFSFFSTLIASPNTVNIFFFIGIILLNNGKQNPKY